MKIVSTLVGLRRYETTSLTDTQPPQKRPLAPATKHRKALKTRPCQAKIIAHSSAHAKPHFTHSSHPFQTILYIICVNLLNN